MVFLFYVLFLFFSLLLFTHCFFSPPFLLTSHLEDCKLRPLIPWVHRLLSKPDMIFDPCDMWEFLSRSPSLWYSYFSDFSCIAGCSFAVPCVAPLSLAHAWAVEAPWDPFWLSTHLLVTLFWVTLSTLMASTTVDTISLVNSRSHFQVPTVHLAVLQVFSVLMCKTEHSIQTPSSQFPMIISLTLVNVNLELC